ncbi:uncharacterized protein RAG0_04248 [Rhynchosporium agropyri]|uniref:Uncharacterized protein n=3 Tax=Rhynchosporium TaxID=38037 RepID=A0A1E1MKC3_RHYSE|nr:uncharacterized protein RAG0_04248 [Rhynchosporium agropyri]CZS99550.1 uncharacterized protein RCO7_07895 [Rhynchosporium commune]CZT49520.1 uncharacterized protein RSE6_10381 [Rhynchosporium secalis]
MGIVKFLRQLCCLFPAYEDQEKPSHLAPLPTTATTQPSLPAGSSRRIRTEAAFRRHFAEVTKVTNLNPKEGSETFARHFAREYERGGKFWRDYERLDPLPPHCRWS